MFESRYVKGLTNMPTKLLLDAVKLKYSKTTLQITDNAIVL